MTKLIKYFVLIVITIVCVTCKKKTTVKVKLLNPILNEYVSNATIVLVERHQGGLFSGGTSCKEIATAVTDDNGECLFDKDKLRTNSNYDYYCAVTESWGIQQTYPCGGKTSRFLAKGKTQDWIVTDYADGLFKIQYNNLFIPAQIGDSLSAIPERLFFTDPISGDEVGRGGVNGGAIFAFDPIQSYPANITQNTPQKLSGVIILKVRKRKMGVTITYTDTIKAYPNQTTVMQVNW